MTFGLGETIGDYEIVGVLGSGGMGRVFRVRNLLSDRIEAMKIVLPDAAEDSGLAERFLREIKVHASLEHPNIASLRTALRVEDRVVMIMELVEGASLAAVIRQGRVELEAALSYAGQVLSALAYAHARGVVHRDIKPANIIVTPEGVVKVTDFGIARAGGNERLTRTGMALGSLYYMSPEQIRGETPDTRSDLYSLGVTLYEMVTGVQPMQGANEYAIMHAHLTEAPRPPSEIDASVPVDISAAILKAMGKAPEQRFQSAADFREALRLPGEAAPERIPNAPATRVAAAMLDPQEVMRVESILTRAVGPIARHLVSQASRRAVTIEELCRLLADQVTDARERESFLRACNSPTAGRTATPPDHSGQTILLGQDVLDEVRRKLTRLLGPVAKVLVDRASRKARSPQDLYSLLAAEIPSERDRASFLASAPK